MSRALDIETIAALKIDGPKSVYDSLVEALSTRTEGLLEIEFLGKSHPLPPGCNVLVDGKNVAVPKSKLVQAFVVARRVLFTYVRNCPEDKEDELRDATTIILLMDPEHLTAANTRKRLIQKHQSCSKSQFQAILRHEMHFVDSYLTSRLHRHTKSPTLWGHRRWILETSKSAQMGCDIQETVESVILVAAERHPRNYYAWSHLRWLVEAFDDILCLEALSGHPPAVEHAETIFIVKDWCLRHPADTSGCSFLLFCLLLKASRDSRSTSERSAQRSTICKEALGRAVSFKWTHESVWVFLRTLVAAEGSVEGDVTEFQEAVRKILDCCSEGQAATVKAARDWFTKYRHEN
jgi:hypothetical protein